MLTVDVPGSDACDNLFACSPHLAANHSIFKGNDKENSYDYSTAQPQARASQHCQSHTSSLSFHLTQGIGESKDVVRLEPDAQEEEDRATQSPAQQRGATRGSRGIGGRGPPNKDAAAQWSVQHFSWMNITSCTSLFNLRKHTMCHIQCSSLDCCLPRMLLLQSMQAFVI